MGLYHTYIKAATLAFIWWFTDSEYPPPRVHLHMHILVAATNWIQRYSAAKIFVSGQPQIATAV